MLVARIVVWLSLLVFLSRTEELPTTSYVKLEKYSNSPGIDTVVYIDEAVPTEEVTILPGLKGVLEDIRKIDASFEQKTSVHPATFPDNKTIERIIFSPTGRLDSDVADSRSIYEAARDALKMGYKAGANKTLLLIGKMEKAPKDYNQEPWAEPKYRNLQALLGALYALYVVSSLCTMHLI
ncbi:unnamed protein product [Dibothriocephalus latus]|uniref:VWFA domain-containing protein n=1 Tax=Dibothriocephalus latus TaxID=60516 RepID=A0A3P7LX65_DIBLA|nr:unnamed protein product [Dibothriocephalus latus]